jgi:hypothetical protein
MPTMKDIQSRLSLLIPMLVLSRCLIACGEQQTSSTNQNTAAEFVHGTVGACLVHAGAAHAISSDDLQFLKEAEANDEVSKPGFAYDRKAKVIVSIWEQSSIGGIVWIGQPFGKSLSPYEIVDSDPPHSYVMFINSNAKSEIRNKAERCITFR